MAREGIFKLRKRIEVLEVKLLVSPDESGRQSAERQPSALPMADLSVLSMEELLALHAVLERCQGLPGPVVDLSLLSPEDRAFLQGSG